MCVVLKPAELEGTTILVVRHADGTETMIYENRVRKYRQEEHPFAPKINQIDYGRQDVERKVGPFDADLSFEQPTLNAMLLPIPAINLSRENVISTKDHPKLLKSIRHAISPPIEFRGGTRGLIGAKAEIWQDGGYTFVLARNAFDMMAALAQRPEIGERVDLPVRFSGQYSDWYTNWPILLPLFDYNSEFDAHPIMLHYTPFSPKSIYLPGLDSHNGELPRRGQVGVDHILAVAVEDWEPENEVAAVEYGAEVEGFSHRHLLPEKVIGRKYHKSKTLDNGDWWLNLEEVRRGIFNPQRVFPADLPRV